MVCRQLVPRQGPRWSIRGEQVAKFGCVVLARSSLPRECMRRDFSGAGGCSRGRGGRRLRPLRQLRAYALHCARADADRVRRCVDAAALGQLTADRQLDLLPTLGRPRRFPCALARRRPACTRSTIIARSNSANTPSISNSARPAGVLVSRPCWCRKRSMPFPFSSPRNTRSCRSDRPRRSTLQAVATSEVGAGDALEQPCERGALRAVPGTADAVVPEFLKAADNTRRAARATLSPQPRRRERPSAPGP